VGCTLQILLLLADAIAYQYFLITSWLRDLGFHVGGPHLNTYSRSFEVRASSTELPNRSNFFTPTWPKESGGPLRIQRDALMYYSITITRRAASTVSEGGRISTSSDLGVAQLRLTCRRHVHTSRRGNAFQLFLSPMRSIRLAGIQ
jgi:hypothetical protein